MDPQGDGLGRLLQGVDERDGRRRVLLRALLVDVDRDRLTFLAQLQGDLHVLGAGDDAGQGVVILGRDRVVLVVVAAGAGHRHRQKGAARHVDLIVNHVIAELPGVLCVHSLRADRQEPGGNHMPVMFGGIL